jgi:aspartate/glutamate racemase
MKRIGIVGGIGPESTVDYYKLIIGAFHESTQIQATRKSSSTVPIYPVL